MTHYQWPVVCGTSIRTQMRLSMAGRLHQRGETHDISVWQTVDEITTLSSSSFFTSMSLDNVNFLGVPLVHRHDEELQATVEFRNGFVPKTDDIVMLLPVGWTDRTQEKSRSKTHGLSVVKISTDALEESPDAMFQLIYVSDGAVLGVSTPFLLGFPDSDESLSCNSFDWVQAADVPTSSSCHNNDKQSVKSADDSVSVIERCGSELYTSADEERFASAGMAFAHDLVDRSRPECGELQMVVTQVVRERDKLSKLFQRERHISLQQEKRNSDLQKAHDLLSHENEDLKYQLRQKDAEIKTLQEHLANDSAQIQKMPHEPLGHTTDIESSFLPSNKARCCPDNASFSACVETALPTTGAKSKREAVRGEVSMDRERLSLQELYCPMCSVVIGNHEHTRFQLHVHSHFRDESDS